MVIYPGKSLFLKKKVHNQKYFKRQEPRLAVESQVWLETLLWKLLFKFPGLALNCWKMTIYIVFSNNREDYLVTYSSKIDKNLTQSPVQLNRLWNGFKDIFLLDGRQISQRISKCETEAFCILKQFPYVMAIW